MDKLINSFLTIKGDSVNMSLGEMALYTILPLGQFLMRIDKFGGSLDKPYLLFPFFLFPPFSIIPVLIAKFGFLVKKEGSKILDIYILIPIIFRFILMFTMAHYGIPGGPILQAALVFAAIAITNIINLLNNSRCKTNKDSFFGKFIKQIGDSMFEYSMGIFIIFLISFVPFAGAFLNIISQIPLPFVGKVSQILDTILWSIGLIGGYMLIKMIDVNYYTNTEICSGKVGLLRIIISMIAFAVAIFFQFKNQIKEFVSSIIPI